MLGIITFVAVLALAGGAFVAWQKLAPTHSQPAAALAAAPKCSTTAKLAVTVDPSIAPEVRQIAAQYDKVKTHCSKITVSAQASADTASMIAAGNGVGVDVWIPDSPVWVNRMQSIASSLGRTAPTLTAKQPIASSPVLFALPTARAGDIGDQKLSWGRVLNGTVTAVIPNPEGSGPSLAGLLALAQHAHGNTELLNTSLIALGKSIPDSAGAALAATVSATNLTIAITTEQQVANYNKTHAAQPLTAVYPADGTLSVQFPYLLTPSSTQNGDTADLASSFEQALLAQPAVFTAAGFRDGSGKGAVDQPGVLPTASPAPAADDGKTELALYKTWGVVTLRGRMLGVIDVSGSMADAAGGGLSRIDVFQQAAVGAISRFSGDVELGLWQFSTNQNGTVPYKQISPIAPLGDPTHMADLSSKIAGLPQHLGGDTGLYETTLAAVRAVRQSYDPNFINSVVVITDGVNDDDQSSLTLQSLVATLKKEADPSKPVPVIMIGFGPDTDIAAMTQIAKATGGEAYTAQQPQDLGTVLTTALTERSCRPNCTP
ncbi:substrate-binding and VWA domain-containing protein [Gryllotalpicola daejeonensis]|uniref:Substrate-binding and VWA domain-containing protein n=1 Tax=Gryllotalpicola daejeonensis TaxID=993087 RepID=A0ABP7ZLR8_9MICO